MQWRKVKHQKGPGVCRGGRFFKYIKEKVNLYKVDRKGLTEKVII